MDFFQAQDDARKKTKHLLFYYGLAIVAIVVSVYGAVTIGFLVYAANVGPSMRPSSVPLWDLSRFLWSTGITSGLIFLGSLTKSMQLRGGGEAVAKALGGERIDRGTQEPKRRQLLNIVEEMALAAGLPIPEVFILPNESSINAFAAGWGQDDSVIAVSAGALERLSRDEIQGVVAHEYSHILYGDCRINIRLIGVLYGILMLSIFASALRVMTFGGRRHGGVVLVSGGRRSGRSGKGNGGALILAIIVVIILITIIGYIGAFFGRLIQSAISRQREFLADAAAVQFTRNPEGIAGALKKIGGDGDNRILENPEAAEAAHLFFSDALSRSFGSAMSTHPPLDLRIRKIDTSWDGEFISGMAMDERSAPKSKQESSKSAAGGADKGKDWLQSMTILGSVGMMEEKHVQNARSVLGAIPEDIKARVRETEGAVAVILGIIMLDNGEDDVAQWKILEGELVADLVSLTKSIYPQLEALPRAARLTLVELATSTLIQLDAFRADSCLQAIDKLITADNKLSLYEFCFQRIVKQRLLRKSDLSSSKTEISFLDLKPELKRAISVLLSVVAENTSSQTDPKTLFGNSTDGLYLLRNAVTYIEGMGGDISELGKSLDTMQKASFAIRSQSLRAVAFALSEDKELSPKEAEILRMISMTLDCPIPMMDLDRTATH